MLTIDVGGAILPVGLDQGDAVQEVWAAAAIPEQNGQESGEATGGSTVQLTQPGTPAGSPGQRVEDVPEVNPDADSTREGSQPRVDGLGQSTITVSIASGSVSGEAQEADSAEQAAEPADAGLAPSDERSAEAENASTDPSDEVEIHGDDASVAGPALPTLAAESSPNVRLDVNRDGRVTALDALLVANYLHAPDLAMDDPAALDVDGDGWITAADFSAVVAGLNLSASDVLTVQSASEGETTWEEYCEQLKANEIATLTQALNDAIANEASQSEIDWLPSQIAGWENTNCEGSGSGGGSGSGSGSGSGGGSESGSGNGTNVAPYLTGSGSGTGNRIVWNGQNPRLHQPAASREAPQEKQVGRTVDRTQKRTTRHSCEQHRIALAQMAVKQENGKKLCPLVRV